MRVCVGILLIVKEKYGYARDIHCVRLIEPTGKAFDRNAIAKKTELILLLLLRLSIIYDALCVI